MAKQHNKTVISLDSEWIKAVDDFGGQRKECFDCLATLKCGNFKPEQNVIRVYSQRIADEIKTGNTYSVTSAGKQVLRDGREVWRCKITTGANQELRKEPQGHSNSYSQHGSGKNDVGQRIGNCLNNATEIAIAEMKAGTSGQIDESRLLELDQICWKRNAVLESLANGESIKQQRKSDSRIEDFGDCPLPNEIKDNFMSENEMPQEESTDEECPF